MYNTEEDIDRLVDRTAYQQRSILTMSSNNLDQLYRSVIMDHYKNPRNKGCIRRKQCNNRYE